MMEIEINNLHSRKRLHDIKVSQLVISPWLIQFNFVHQILKITYSLFDSLSSKMKFKSLYEFIHYYPYVNCDI